MTYTIDRRQFGAVTAATLIAACSEASSGDAFAVPPSGFTSAFAEAAGARLHYVRGGQGPAIVLLHGFPQDWVAYKAVMPLLADRFTVIAVDLPGIGRSAPAPGGYEAVNLAQHIHALVATLELDRPYIVGHDLGGIVNYAFVRRFPKALRGAMILDVPVPGVGGWEESTHDLWHLGMIQTPGLAEEIISPRPAPFLNWCYAQGRFTPEERNYFISMYQPPQLHAAFEIYRGFPKDAEWNVAHTEANEVPLTIGFGERSFFAPFEATFAEGYRARGMRNVKSSRITDAGHCVMADNPSGVADFIAAHA